MKNGRKQMIEIYGKSTCPYCDKAKALCESKGLTYEYKSLGTDLDLDELLELFPNAKTVPQIMIDGKSVGGYHELEKYINAQEGN